MGDLKTEVKSIRMTKKVFDYVDGREGTNGFAQKFEDMVLYCMEKEKELDKNIKSKTKELEELNLKIAKKKQIINQKLPQIEYNITQLLSSY